MKVLYISAELNWCGATMSFMNLLRGMRKIGVECKVVAPDLGNTSQEIINFFWMSLLIMCLYYISGI